MDRADGQLLTQFVTERSESAFEALVQRHGGMVFGACRRLLRDPHDAEDAFQATFLVLARNAAKLRKSDSVASWLHGVALRVGLNAKRQAARRREHEKEARDMIRTESETTWRDLGPVLDEELGRLPERLRAPVVLCYLEDKSTEEAAKELGWSHGTLRGRLAKARDTLRGRLSRRGIAIGAALLASLISKNATAATVPPLCLASTVQAAVTVSTAGALASAGVSGKAAALAEAALKAMAWAKVKVAACVLAAGAVVGGGAAVVSVMAREAFTPVENAAVAQAEGESPRATAVRGPARPSPAVAGRNARPGGRIPAAAPAPDPEPETVDPAAREARAKLRVRGLPEGVLGSIIAGYPGAVVDEVEPKTRGGRTIYKVDLEVDGRDVELELGADGTIRKAKEE
ncbi:MAG: RNA polymerase sigma factor, partial [Planctomycetota bacterium]